jgi:hypothetical protein
MVYCVELAGQTCLEPLGSTFPSAGLIDSVEALVDVQVSVAHSPCFTDAGLTDNEAVGDGFVQPKSTTKNIATMIFFMTLPLRLGPR